MTVDARPGSLTDMLRGCKIAPPKRINELLNSSLEMEGLLSNVAA